MRALPRRSLTSSFKASRRSGHRLFHRRRNTPWYLRWLKRCGKRPLRPPTSEHVSEGRRISGHDGGAMESTTGTTTRLLSPFSSPVRMRFSWGDHVSNNVSPMFERKLQDLQRMKNYQDVHFQNLDGQNLLVVNTFLSFFLYFPPAC
jgi:hypothetical protein